VDAERLEGIVGVKLTTTGGYFAATP